MCTKKKHQSNQSACLIESVTISDPQSPPVCLFNLSPHLRDKVKKYFLFFETTQILAVFNTQGYQFHCVGSKGENEKR